MIPIYTITSTQEEIQKQSRSSNKVDYEIAYQARPKTKLPILFTKGKDIQLKTHTWSLNKRTDIKTNRILAKRPFNILVRKNRCAIPCNCFFLLKNGKPHLTRILKQRLFYLGGIYDQDGFLILKTESPDILTFSKHIPVVITNENLTSWLQTTDMQLIMQLLDKGGNNWFDYYEVSDKIINQNLNEKELLLPIGSTFIERERKLKHLRSLTFDSQRPNRSNSKY